MADKIRKQPRCAYCGNEDGPMIHYKDCKVANYPNQRGWILVDRKGAKAR